MLQEQGQKSDDAVAYRLALLDGQDAQHAATDFSVELFLAKVFVGLLFLGLDRLVAAGFLDFAQLHDKLALGGGGALSVAENTADLLAQRSGLALIGDLDGVGGGAGGPGVARPGGGG